MKSSFPNGSQFSPTQTPLPELLVLVRKNQTDRDKIKRAITQRFFARSADPDISDNTIYALSEYGLLDKPTDNIAYAALTKLGEDLSVLAEEGNTEALYRAFAQHILTNLRGLDLVQCVDDLVARGTKLTKATISKELGYRGFHIPANGTHLNAMRQWFEKAGLVGPRRWEANPEVLRAILGDIGNEEIDKFAQLTREQRAFALAFARLNKDEALSNRVASYASVLYGVQFPEGGLPQSTLFALQDAGLITCRKTTGGQGAKPYIVSRTELLTNEFIEPIFQAIEESVGIQYRQLIRMPYADILTGLGSDSRNEKGLALEALAFYLGRLIDLDFVRWRLRSKETGGAELDVIMEGANLVFSRWQVQCKNSSQATLEDIAKELGVAQIIRTNVIMIVTTGRIGDKARDFAETVMRETNHQVVLLHGRDLARLKEDPTEITSILRSQSKTAMALKRDQIGIL